MKKSLLTTLLLASLFSFVSAQSSLGDTEPGDEGTLSSSEKVCYDLQRNLGQKNIGIYRNSDRYTNNEVTKLQNFLQDYNFLNVEATGYFGTKTLAAVKSFQRSSNILASGYVGPITRAKIKTDTCGNTQSDKDLVVCTVEARMCEDGSTMPRGPGCSWHPEKCPGVTEINSTNVQSSVLQGYSTCTVPTYTPGVLTNSTAASLGTCTITLSWPTVTTNLDSKVLKWQFTNGTTWFGNTYLTDSSLSSKSKTFTVGKIDFMVVISSGNNVLATKTLSAVCATGAVRDTNGRCVTSATGQTSANPSTITVSNTATVPAGACYFNETTYRNRGLKSTVTASDSASWLNTNNMISVNGKLYLLNKPSVVWSLWDTTTNQLTSVILSCKDGVITETGTPATKKVPTAEEVLAQTEDDIKTKCNNGTFPNKYAVCQPKALRLQYLKDKFVEERKPMSLATLHSYGPGFENSELAFSDWKYVTVGPFVVGCDELATTYGFTWLKGEGGAIGSWAAGSNRDFYSDGKFIGSGGAAIHTTQYKDKITGEAMTEPDITYEAIGHCRYSPPLDVSSTAPLLTINRAQVNNEQVLSWTTKNISSLTYNCLDSDNKSSGDISVALNLPTTTTPWSVLRQNGWKGQYHCTWKANGTTVVGTESFTIGN